MDEWKWLAVALRPFMWGLLIVAVIWACKKILPENISSVLTMDFKLLIRRIRTNRRATQ
jgi:hypothetical protein